MKAKLDTLCRKLTEDRLCDSLSFVTGLIICQTPWFVNLISTRSYPPPFFSKWISDLAVLNTCCCFLFCWHFIIQDVQFGDIDYMIRQKDFTYDNVNFKGLPEFVRDIKKDGLRYIIILVSVIMKSPFYANSNRCWIYLAKGNGRSICSRLNYHNLITIPCFS